jgi:hypothetical protein
MMEPIKGALQRAAVLQSSSMPPASLLLPAAVLLLPANCLQAVRTT